MDERYPLELKRYFAIGFYTCFTTFIWTTLFLFLARRNTSAIRQRSVSLSAVSSLSGWFMITNYFAMETGWPYPCFFTLWFSSIFSMLWIFTFVARCIRLVVLSYYNKQLVTMAINSFHSDNRDNTICPFSEGQSSWDSWTNVKSSSQGQPRKRLRTTSALKLNPNTDFINKKYASESFLWKAVGSAMLVIIAYTAVIQGVTKHFTLDLDRDGPDCGSSWEFLHVYLITGLIIVAVFPAILWSLDRHAIRRDTYGMRRDMLLSIALLIPIYAAYGLLVFVADIKPESQARVSSLFSPNYLILIAVMILHVFGIIIPIYRSLQETKLREKSISFGSFVKFINSPESWNSIKTGLAKDFCVELGFFIDHYRDLVDVLQTARFIHPDASRSTNFWGSASSEFKYISSMIVHHRPPQAPSPVFGSSSSGSKIDAESNQNRANSPHLNPNAQTHVNSHRLHRMPSTNALMPHKRTNVDPPPVNLPPSIQISTQVIMDNTPNEDMVLMEQDIKLSAPTHSQSDSASSTSTTSNQSMSSTSLSTTTATTPPASSTTATTTSNNMRPPRLRTHTSTTTSSINEEMNVDPDVPFHLISFYRSFYETFIVDGAPLQVNLTSQTVDKIRTKVTQSHWTLAMFDEAAKEVLELMWEARVGRNQSLDDTSFCSL